MRVVLDTNVFIPGLRNHGKPRIVLEQAVLGIYTLILTEDIRLEIEAVLSRKLAWPKPISDYRFWRVMDVAEMVAPAEPVTDCVDPDDNMFLEAAAEGRADCIVSGDKHLLAMKRLRGIEIWTVDQFLGQLPGGQSSWSDDNR